jgi:hypothetical protein
MAINIDERFLSREQTDTTAVRRAIYLAVCTDGRKRAEAKYAVLDIARRIRRHGS